jgi:hypothetical protein
MTPTLHTFAVVISQHLGSMGQLIDQNAVDVHAQRTITVQAINSDIAVDLAERETGRMACACKRVPAAEQPHFIPSH